MNLGAESFECFDTHLKQLKKIIMVTPLANKLSDFPEKWRKAIQSKAERLIAEELSRLNFKIYWNKLN